MSASGPPARIGRYRLVRTLGQGAQATVHEAVSEPDGGRVALKRLHPHVSLLQADAVSRLRREVGAARAVDHPGVVRPLDAGEEGGVHFVVYELVLGARPITHAFAGRTLGARVALVRDAARALGAAHAKGIVHRDVSASNVLVDQGGRVRVTDFGLAWAPEQPALTPAGAALGTPRAIAPEALLLGSKAATTPRLDVWSLGVLLFEAATGQHPVEGVGPRDVDPRVPAALDAVCRKALAPRPEDRYADGEALALALEAAVSRSTAQNPVLSSLAVTPARPPGSSPIELGARLGRCVLLEKIGQGGMGTVYRARDDALGRDVAVKVLASDASDDRRRRFVREVQAAARIHHPNVVAVHDAGEAQGCLYLVMDLVTGRPLDETIARGALEPRAAAQVMLAVARALEALHGAGVLHRDLKPANVLLDPAGVPLLTDFGVAALAGAERLTRTNQAIGTPLYMAPEQLDGRSVDERADVYGLGALLYEALTGEPPFAATSVVQLAVAKAEGAAAPSTRRAGIDPALDALCLRALTFERDERLPSAKALADDLERWLAGGRVEATAPPRRRRTTRAVAGGLAVAVALAVLGAALVATRAREPLAARAAAARRDLEARAAGAPRLAQVDLGDVPALLAEAAPGAEPDAARDLEALRAWTGLVQLARGEVDAAAAAAAAVGTESGGAPALALHGGLAVTRGSGHARGAAAGLLRAARAGLAQVEVEGWRLRALGADGVVERGDAQGLLRDLAPARRRGAVDEATADALEAAAEAALGRRAEAERALARVASPSAELRWSVALLAVADEVGRGDVQRARARAREHPRPAGPARPAERALTARLVEWLRPRLASDDARLGSIGDRVEVEVAAALELHGLLTPDDLPPDTLRAQLLELAQGVAAVQGMSDLALLAFAEVWPRDAEVQVAVTRILASANLDASPALVAAGIARRAAELAPPPDRAMAAVSWVRHLLVAGEYTSARGALAPAEAAVEAAAAGQHVDRHEVDLLRGQLALHRGVALTALGETDAALAALEEAASLPEVVPGERLVVRMRALMEARRDDLAIAEGERYLASPLGVGPNRKNLAEYLWQLFVRNARWSLAQALTDELVVRQRLEGHGLWVLRRALVHARTGGHAVAADELLGSTSAIPLPPDLAARLRAGDERALLELARALHEQPERWAVSAAAPPPPRR
jgi:serine/threonine protein kinase/tetratricopeptide (TPR) repeat protein